MSKFVEQNESGGLTVTTKFNQKFSLVRVMIDKENFLKICETLQRIGVYSSKEETIWQSAHILHKKGFYYIVHFKELFALDGRFTNFSEEDKLRRDVIVGLLLKWNLVSIPDAEYASYVSGLIKETEGLPVKLRVVSFKDRRNFNLKTKYPIGKIKNAVSV